MCSLNALTDVFFTKVGVLRFDDLWIFKKVYDGKLGSCALFGYELDFRHLDFGRGWLAPLVDAKAHAKGRKVKSYDTVTH